MSLIIELKLKSNKTIKTLEYDLSLILIFFKAMPLIKTAPKMKLISYFVDGQQGN